VDEVSSDAAVVITLLQFIHQTFDTGVLD